MAISKHEETKGNAPRAAEARSEFTELTETRAYGPATLGRMYGAELDPLMSMAPMLGYSPFSTVRRMFDDMWRMLEGITGPEFERPARVMRARPLAAPLAAIPQIDIFTRDDRMFVRADLPGFAMADLKVNVEDGALVLEGERRAEAEHPDDEVWRMERAHGRFRRVIPLPEGCTADGAEARFENGVLEVSLRTPARALRGTAIKILGSGQPARPGTH
jgi:HSP20 family protein